MKMKDVLLACMLILPMSFKPVSAQVDEGLNNDYITKDTYLIMAVHPKIIQSRIDKGNETLKLLTEFMKEQAAMDIGKMTRFQLMLGGPKDAESEFDQIAVVLEFDSEIDREAITEMMFQHSDYEVNEYAGEEIIVTDDEYDPTVWYPNKSTLIFSDQSRIKSMIDHSQNMPSTKAISKRIKGDEDFVCSIDLTDLSESRREMLNDMVEFWAPEELNVENMEALADYCLFSFRSKSPIPLKLEFGAKNEDSLDDLNARVESIWKGCRKKIEELEELMSEEEIPNDMEKTVDRLLNGFKLIHKEAGVSRAGKRISIQLERMQGFKEGAELIVELFAMPMHAIGPPKIDD